MRAAPEVVAGPVRMAAAAAAMAAASCGGAGAARSLSRFRGCLAGALLGDCVGAIYEAQDTVSLTSVLRHVQSLEPDPGSTGSARTGGRGRALRGLGRGRCRAGRGAMGRGPERVRAEVRLRGADLGPARPARAPRAQPACTRAPSSRISPEPHPTPSSEARRPEPSVALGRHILAPDFTVSARLSQASAPRPLSTPQRAPFPNGGLEAASLAGRSAVIFRGPWVRAQRHAPCQPALRSLPLAPPRWLPGLALRAAAPLGYPRKDPTASLRPPCSHSSPHRSAGSRLRSAVGESPWRTCSTGGRGADPGGERS